MRTVHLEGSAPALTLGIGEPGYPPLLRQIHDPPALLHVRGDGAVLSRPQFAIVGSRRASAAARRLAARIAGQLTAAGLAVCSGMALGIDGAAHRGALEAGGETVAVLGTGADRIYPARHRDLAREILGAGCLVSEFPPGTPPRRGNFPARNRIISGMSLGVLVVEAAAASGSLITARLAAEQGREVFALPWSPLHEGGAGCLLLLRDGAKMVLGVEDVLEELGPLFALHAQSAPAPPERPPGEAGEGNWLLDLLGFETLDLDTLVQASGRPAPEVLRELSALEIAGRVARLPGGYARS